MQRYQLITQAEIEMIHENTLRIMKEIGVVMPHEHAKETLKKHGATVEGDLVKFPRELVERCIKDAPDHYTLHGRDSKYDVHISTEYTAHAGPYGSPFVLDLDRGKRDATRDDFIKIVKIVHNLKNIDIQSHISCEPQDVDVKKRPTTMTYDTMKYSSKPFMGSIYGYKNSMDSIKMASIPFGGLDAIKDKPVLASIPCTLTPLAYDGHQLEAVQAYAETGQVQLINSLSILGMTVPVTIVGLVSLQNAEVLAGICYAQCINPGTPVVYSASGTSADMGNSLLTIGTPEDALVSLVNGQLAKFYKIPCRISGALSDSKMMDAQAAYEAMYTQTMAHMAGGNFILHSCGIIESYNTTSFEKLIIDNEICGYLRRISRGITVDEETLAFDAIKEVGPQGTFVTCDHTAENFRDELYFPTLSDHAAYGNWKAAGSKPIEQVANEKWHKILDDYVEPTLTPDIDKELQKFIENA